LIAHRKDIDGLRAAAVVPVVLYHAGVPGFSGGFAGVDIFFVISGYLITQMIAADLGGSRFSLLNFYARRVRRIVPALLAMLAVVTAAGVIVFTGPELRSYGMALASAALFGANVYFWRTQDYFTAEPEPSPLLHTWSLAVEEQFYILWPLALMLLFALGWRKAVPWLAIAGAIAGLALAVVLVRINPQFSFYMLPTRAWELLLGAVLVLGAVPALTRAMHREIAAALGLAMVLASVFALNNTMEVPGPWLLLPCLGAALLLHAGASGETVAGRALSWAPIVWIGLISYSLYLWHWPLLILPQLVLARDLLPAETAAAIALSVAAAALSWRYVEQPFRRASVQQPTAQTRFVVAGGAALAAVATLGVSLSHLAPAARLEGATRSPDIQTFSQTCMTRDKSSGTASELPPLEPCVFGATKSASPEVVLWGDSHANHLHPALDAWAKARGLTVRQVAKALCPPVLGASPFIAPRNARADCAAFNAQTLDWIKATPSVKYVVLAARWPIYVGASYPRHGVTPVLAKDGAIPASDAEARALLTASLGRLTRELSALGKMVALIGPLPDFYQSGAKCVERTRAFGWPDARCDAAGAETALRLQPVHDAMKAAQNGADWIETSDLFCTIETCKPVKDGRLQFRDDNHVTPDGARRIVDRLPPP
jgi:peptidoglycan/LPS O-acetylase OafA/YrhL